MDTHAEYISTKIKNMLTMKDQKKISLERVSKESIETQKFSYNDLPILDI